jgi:hypothetical protein
MTYWTSRENSLKLIIAAIQYKSHPLSIQYYWNWNKPAEAPFSHGDQSEIIMRQLYIAGIKNLDHRSKSHYCRKFYLV